MKKILLILVLVAATGSMRAMDDSLDWPISAQPAPPTPPGSPYKHMVPCPLTMIPVPPKTGALVPGTVPLPLPLECVPCPLPPGVPPASSPAPPAADPFDYVFLTQQELETALSLSEAEKEAIKKEAILRALQMQVCLAATEKEKREETELTPAMEIEAENLMVAAQLAAQQRLEAVKKQVKEKAATFCFPSEARWIPSDYKKPLRTSIEE